jgi:hypothetical protein
MFVSGFAPALNFGQSMGGGIAMSREYGNILNFLSITPFMPFSPEFEH